MEYDVDIAGVIDDVCFCLDYPKGQSQFFCGCVVGIGSIQPTFANGKYTRPVFVKRNVAGPLFDTYLGKIGVHLAGHLFGYCIAAEGGKGIVAFEDKCTALEIPCADELIFTDCGEGVEYGTEDT